ncbi:hypothetical protein DO97_20015 [Neosynechococcus sphagnicola sy1]|uniref:Uncharacterized protein n=1 Tax=Neosynechococcus sphagnicola sy1 TaxID=1497020 RepID=A0A098TM90_9CYAN|nr:hypothetical protein [Neosynechococcus sphagnicola]KGF73381.1 hypothetical protein DO97_20015 [Neosynechococcus sphagnicola sy1]
MSKFKFSVLISAACLMGIFFYGLVGVSQSSPPSVRLTTMPSVQQIMPFEAEATSPQTPVQLTLQAVDGAGHALENVNLHLQILTPNPTPWLTTDFPMVEGTELLEMTAIAPQGILTLQQMLPIRGTYQLRVQATPIVPHAFTPIAQTLTFSVSENWVKYRNFAILAVSFIDGRPPGGAGVIGERSAIQPGAIAPQSVRLLLSGAIVVAIAALLWINISAELAPSPHSMAMSHDMGMSHDMEVPPAVEIPTQARSQGWEMHLSGDSHARVGQPAHLQVQVMDTQTHQPATDVLLRITTTQLENHWIAFAYEGIPDPQGQFVWQQQFFDGAAHQVTVEAAPQVGAERQFRPFQVGQILEVEGVAPPLRVRIITLIYLTTLVGLGVLLGFQLRRWQPGLSSAQQ